MVPHRIWLKNSYIAKVIKCKKIYFIKTIRVLEQNSRMLSTANLRHISIHYLFIEDRIDKGEAKVEYFPSTYMLADYFTKPLQGIIFR